MSMIPKEIEDYCIEHSTRPSETAKALQQHTLESVHGAQMLIGEMEGSILQFLLRLNGAKRVLELGTFTGYSALVMAEALPEDGEVITVDINPHTTQIAREYWERSPHGKKIKQILKPGLEALNELSGEFDLIFIDADKNNYSNYLQWGLKHLSDKGVIVTDNTLWSGKVIHPAEDKQTKSIQEHNEMARELKGHVKTLLPIRDGMYLIQKG